MQNLLPKINLSICIPTYNFGAFIGETLESVISQATDAVEIVVVDGASTDNTQEVVRSFQLNFSRLHYIRLEKKGGIDQDMARAVEYAQGTYCWLFGADDIMAKDAIKLILQEIKSGHDLYLSETTLCRFDLAPIKRYRNLKLSSERTFNLSNTKERHEYFQLALNTQPFFSFCGALIFKREKWIKHPADDAFMGSCWAHAARFFAMLADGLLIKHLPIPLSLKRCDNDSFSDKGIVNRYRISIEGYNKIADTFFGHSSTEAFHMRRVLKQEMPIWRLLNMKSETQKHGNQDMSLLNKLVAMQYADPLLQNRIGLLVYQWMPLLLFDFIYKMARRIKRFLNAR